MPSKLPKPELYIDRDKFCIVEVYKVTPQQAAELRDRKSGTGAIDRLSASKEPRVLIVHWPKEFCGMMPPYINHVSGWTQVYLNLGKLFVKATWYTRLLVWLREKV